MKSITESDIQAFLDQELDEDQAREVCAYLQNDRASQEYYNKISYQKLMLQSWWYKNNTHAH